MPCMQPRTALDTLSNELLASQIQEKNNHQYHHDSVSKRTGYWADHQTWSRCLKGQVNFSLRHACKAWVTRYSWVVSAAKGSCSKVSSINFMRMEVFSTKKAAKKELDKFHSLLEALALLMALDKKEKEISPAESRDAALTFTFFQSGSGSTHSTTNQRISEWGGGGGRNTITISGQFSLHPLPNLIKDGGQRPVIKLKVLNKFVIAPRIQPLKCLLWSWE